MRRRLIPAFVIAAALAGVGAASTVQQPAQAPPRVTVHEWGTFTSVAAADGRAQSWVPLTAPPDLPCFVERDLFNTKVGGVATVRMETPVLYFYAPQAFDASVHVAFPRGLITEWYPHANSTSAQQTHSNGGGAIAWPRVHVDPGAPDAFTVESHASHYYAARRTAASPVRVGTQNEKFLFYRGLGNFQPQLTAVTRDDGSVALNSSAATLGDVIYFESRRGVMTFTAHHLKSNTAMIARPLLDDASGPPLTELKRMLIAAGLFEAEAQAMIDTWKDSWFEEGARLFYVVPRAEIDAILPLTVAPQPTSVTRVFVGRVELITTATIRDVRAAIASNDRALLAKYGRFLQPIAERAGVADAVPASAWPAAASPSCR